MLRFFAAAVVFGYHTLFIGPILGVWSPSLLTPFFYAGDLGVDLFFVISGFVITLSSENRTTWQFLRSRILRLFPAFWVCSAITLLFSLTIPVVNTHERLVAWTANLFFFPQVFGLKYFSAVYWTLAAEVTFYIWVAVMIGVGAWSRFRDQVIAIWLLIAILGIFLIRSGPLFEFLDGVFITRYTGHFVLGMVLYEVRKKGVLRAFDVFVLVVCWFLITHSINRFDMWITGITAQAGGQVLDSSFLVFAAPLICALVWWVSHIEKVRMPARVIMTLGAMSYPFYLLHSDFAFWVRYSFYDNLAGVNRFIGPLSEWWLVGFGFVMSVVLSYVVVAVLEPRLYSIVKKLLEGMEGLFAALFRFRGVKEGG